MQDTLKDHDSTLYIKSRLIINMCYADDIPHRMFL